MWRPCISCLENDARTTRFCCLHMVSRLHQSMCPLKHKIATVLLTRTSNEYLIWRRVSTPYLVCGRSTNDINRHLLMNYLYSRWHNAACSRQSSRLQCHRDVAVSCCVNQLQTIFTGLMVECILIKLTSRSFIAAWINHKMATKISLKYDSSSVVRIETAKIGYRNLYL